MQHVIPGIHHVTAIAGPAQQNVDFYTGLLGLRLVKQTVNFDDPGTYHLYYGDALGHPGSIFTFFPWPKAHQGHAGAGMVSATAYAVSQASIAYWLGRFAEANLPCEAPVERFGESVVRFTDPDGLPLELIGSPHAAPSPAPGWRSDVPPEHSIQRFHSTTLLLADLEPTARLLVDIFGYEAAGEEGGRLRFVSPGGKQAHIMDLIRMEDPARGRSGKGTIHHVAFRARNDDAQAEWRDRLLAEGLEVTPTVDRQYFHSIYFREPGGVLFEIATDPPGFTTDETPDELGTSLMLPEWFESHRRRIEQHLPKLQVRAAQAG